MTPWRRAAARRLAALWLALAVGVPAAAADEDAAPDTGPDTTLLPRPAEMAPRAARALLLDIAATADGFVCAGPHGILLRSPDGRAWQQVAMPVSVTLTRLRFVDARHGWVTGYDGTLLETLDAGAHWRISQYDPAWGRPWFDVFFVDADHGLLAGANGMLKKSGDGGRTWDAVSSDALQDAGNLYALTRLDNGLLLLAGERGFLARSADRGATWTRLQSPYAGSYFGALATGGGAVVVYGLRGNAFRAGDVAHLPPAAPAAAGGGDDSGPIYTDVAGWTRLASDDHESLFGGARDGADSALLFGMNGRVMRLPPGQAQLQRLVLPTGMSINAGLLAPGALLLVGTQGVQRVPRP